MISGMRLISILMLLTVILLVSNSIYRSIPTEDEKKLLRLAIEERELSIKNLKFQQDILDRKITNLCEGSHE